MSSKNGHVTYPYAAPGDECQRAEKIGGKLVICGRPAVCARVVERGKVLSVVLLCRGCYEAIRAAEAEKARGE